MLLIQITAAHGPTECEYAARLTLRELLKEAQREGTALQLLEETPTVAGCKSALLRIEAEAMPLWLKDWLGTIQWVFESPFRPHHPRKNWFVAVQRCAAPEALPQDSEILFQACRASGKGGQRVNTTDSAVHAIHVASGIAVKVMTERSQHANKRLARELIALKLAQRQELSAQQSAKQRSQQHWKVERGKPVKLMRG
ncbi:peptide chain release factor H [Comamonas testosteroni]|uniref:Peptide chain release factor H n=1 Tax=Comamonas testosteroni TaxID=285 RepID=A0A373FS23_COMTE|nr:peptide chain release factor H [Comamonas testosteroni]RGE46938.1 peptide chain release factor H [Comamonas testosteroni]